MEPPILYGWIPNISLISPTYVGPPNLSIPGNVVLCICSSLIGFSIKDLQETQNGNYRLRPFNQHAHEGRASRGVGGWVFSMKSR